MTVTGKTMAENLKDAPRLEAHQKIIADIKRPLRKSGHLVILRGNLAPEGSVAKVSGLKRTSITGPARNFNSEEECLDAILGKKIMEGDKITIDGEGGILNVDLSEAEIKKRLSLWKAPPLKYKGVLRKYAKVVSS